MAPKGPTKAQLQAEYDEFKANAERVKLDLEERIRELEAQAHKRRALPKSSDAGKSPATPSKRKFDAIDVSSCEQPDPEDRDGKKFPLPYDAEQIKASTFAEDIKAGRRLVPFYGADSGSEIVPKWDAITVFVVQLGNDRKCANGDFRQRRGESEPQNMLQTRFESDRKDDADTWQQINLKKGKAPNAINIEAALMTIFGVPLPGKDACERCAKGSGPFQFCTVLNGFGAGSCSNCHYNAQSKQCSHREDSQKRSSKKSVVKEQD